MRTPTAKARRKALSPTEQVPVEAGPSFSSPYAVVELGMDENEMRAHILEQDTTIRELRRTIKRMEEDMNSKMNESILIETSNRINSHESRLLQKDIAIYEHEVKEMKENLRIARLDLSAEMNKRKTIEDDLTRRTIELEEFELKLKSANEAASKLQEKLVEKDQRITQLGSEISAAKFEYSVLETRYAKSKQDCEEAKSRNKTLTLEVASLKIALAECKEELRRGLEAVKDQKENMTKREIELRRSLESNLVSHNLSTSHSLINAFQSLSSQIETIQKTNLTSDQVADIQLKIGELTATNRFLEGKVMEYEEKENTLAKHLAEAQGNAETAKAELAELQKKLVEIEGSSTLTHQYLLEESNKIKQQKAALRCELIELRRDYNKLKEKLEKMESIKVDAEEVEKLRAELDSSHRREEHFKIEEARLKEELQSMQEKVRELEEALNLAKQKQGDVEMEQSMNCELREELKKAEAKLIELYQMVDTVDTQCEQYRLLKKRADETRQKALDECSQMATKLRETQRELELQKASEVEVNQLRAEKDRLEMKIRYLNDELRETHNDYRAELAQLARQISESKHKDATDNESYVQKIDELNRKVGQMESTSRSARRHLEELKLENEKLQEQVSDVAARELEVANENKKLRSGLAEAVSKIEQYKKDAENCKEMCKEMAEQLGANEEQIRKLEDEVANLEETLREKEKLEEYLQSQVKAKDMPKLSRRSTLLRTPSDISLEVIDPVIVEELENEKSSLLRELEEKKKVLMSRKMMPPPLPKDHRCQPSPIYSNPYSVTPTRNPLVALQSKSVGDVRGSFPQNKSSALATPKPQKAIMRHDIPHSWNEVRKFGVFSIKCAVCFVGVPTFAKKKQCEHCKIIVHSHCSKRVGNTCGLSDQCANFYLDTYSKPNGRMNGWVRLFRDDSNVREWQSAWGEMDEKRLAFYDNDSVQTDLRKPFLSVDLENELRIVRVGSEVPLKMDNGQVSHNIVHIKTDSRNIYILAPSIQTAKRWAEALQSASTRRMMLTRRPSSFSEQSCLLVLSRPNNLTIHTTCVIDDYLLIGAQSGLFYTNMTSARVPVRIGGFNSVTAMACLTDLNILALIIDHKRSLALLPLPALKLALNDLHPSVRPDVVAGYDHLHAISYHRQDGQRYLCAASSAKIYVLKYNATRDVFTGHQMIETREPAMCMLSTCNGLFFGADSFYFVQLTKGQLDPVRLVESSVADYPVALLQIRDDEILLAYQNHGIFVNSRGERTRNETVEWEHMPMEFEFTAPYLYVVHYDSIEILQVAEYTGPDSRTILDEREVFECRNAHVVCCRPNGDVLISISNTDSVEVHRFNATNSKRSAVKRKGLTAATFDKRSRVGL
nr:Pleckstrin homology and Citron domain containing protein [Haemonchus contortus]